jgi:DNA mismatch repair ATPase MutS
MLVCPALVQMQNTDKSTLMMDTHVRVPGSMGDEADQGLSQGGLGLRAASLTQYMKLDSAAVSSLNLFPAIGDTNKESSVHGVLDKCVTKRIGSRLLARWLRQPLLDVADLRKRQVHRTLACISSFAYENALGSLTSLSEISSGF